MMTTFADGPMPLLDTSGLDDADREAAERYATMVGMDLPREVLLEELRSVAWNAPVRKVRRPE